MIAVRLSSSAYGRVLERLPDRSFGHLAVAAQHPDAVGQLVEALAGERDADADRQALAERAGRHVDPRQHRSGMALEAAPELAERQQLLVGDRAGGLEEAVVERRGVSLGEDQVVVAGIVGAGEVVAQVLGEQHGHQVGGRHRRRRMARAGGVARPDRVDAELLSELAPEGGVIHTAIVPTIAGGEQAATSALLALRQPRVAHVRPRSAARCSHPPADRRGKPRRHAADARAEPHRQRRDRDLGAVAIDRRDHRPRHLLGRPRAHAGRQRGAASPRTCPASRTKPGQHHGDADAMRAEVLAQPEREPTQPELRRRVDRGRRARRPCPTATR